MASSRENTVSEGTQHETFIRGLRRLVHLSDAYMQGAITQDEIAERRILPDFVRDVSAAYGPDGFMNRFVTTGLVNRDHVVPFLRSVNREHWHMPGDEFNRTMSKITRLPASPVTHKAPVSLQPMKHDEAFAYAKNHHDGWLHSFLKSYRHALHLSAEDIGVKYAPGVITKQRVMQLEDPEVTPTETLRERALELGADNVPLNLWQLPVDKNGLIRAEVVDYLHQFGKERDRSTAQHWIRLDELAELPGFEKLDAAPFADREALGPHTARLEAPPQKLQRVINAINAELEKQPAGSLPLITLPDGNEVLVDRKHDNVPHRLLMSEMPLWRNWLVNETRREPADGLGAG